MAQYAIPSPYSLVISSYPCPASCRSPSTESSVDWSGEVSFTDLEGVGAKQEPTYWQRQKTSGGDAILIQQLAVPSSLSHIQRNGRERLRKSVKLRAPHAPIME